MSDVGTTLWSAKVTAQKLGISPHTLAQYRSRGRGPQYIRLGGRVYYKPSCVTEWLDSLVEGPKPQKR